MRHSDEFVATLVHEDELPKHLGEVMTVSTNHLRVVRRKFLSRAGWEAVDIPLDDCVAITYKDERPLFRILVGALLVCLTVIIYYLLWRGGDQLKPGTTLPIGVPAVAALVGLRWTFRSRRHRLTFLFRERHPLTWKSRAGDYKAKAASVRRALSFARTSGRLSLDSSTFPMEPAGTAGD